jgi:hypothetical protein
MLPFWFAGGQPHLLRSRDKVTPLDVRCRAVRAYTRLREPLYMLLTLPTMCLERVFSAPRTTHGNANCAVPFALAAHGWHADICSIAHATL